MRRWVTKAFLLAVALFAVSELGARVFFAQSVYGRFEYGYHPTAGFEEASDDSVRLLSAGGRRFRPQTFPHRRPPGTFRIMVVGDSVPRGGSLEGAYPAQLAAELANRGIRTEGLNLAVAGYGAHRAAGRPGTATDPRSRGTGNRPRSRLPPSPVRPARATGARSRRCARPRRPGAGARGHRSASRASDHRRGRPAAAGRGCRARRGR